MQKLFGEKTETCLILSLIFIISMGGIAGTLKEMRDIYFQAPQGSLLYRPFKIVPKEPFDELSFDMFIEKARQLQYKNDGSINLPNNKISELREVINLSEEAARKFVQEQKFRGRQLPDIEGHLYSESLFENNITPYYDMIEILRFYPDFALNENGVMK